MNQPLTTPPAPLAVLGASRDDLSFSGRVCRPEREQLWRSNHTPAATALLTPSPFRTQTKIRDTLNNLILKSPQNWQTAIGLPFFQIQGTVVEWCVPHAPILSTAPTLNLIPILTLIRDEVKFDVRLMQRVPYEGVSRMQTSLRRKHRDRVVRRGLALIIESDFYATDAGRQHFADQLTSIRYVRAAHPVPAHRPRRAHPPLPVPCAVRARDVQL